MRISEYLVFQDILCGTSEFHPSLNADEQFWIWVKSYWSSLALGRKMHLQNMIQCYMEELQDYSDSDKMLSIVSEQVEA
jgi:hypothetical protein